MSDKIKGLTVIFEKEVSEEYAELVSHSIRIIKGVIKVEKDLMQGSDHILKSQVRRELHEKIFNALHE